MARNITVNRIMVEGNTVPRSVRVINFRDGGSVLNVTVVTQTDLYGPKAGGGWEVTGQKPEYHNVVVKGGSDRLGDILKERSLFVRVEGAVRYREWERAHRTNSGGQWEDYIQVDGSKLMLKTTVAEIIVGGNGSEFRIMPCVNSRDGNNAQGAHSAPANGSAQSSPPPWSSPDDDNLGPAFPSEASGMDDVPF